MLAEYARRRALVIERLSRLPGVRLTPPAGTFYAFPNFSRLLAARGFARADDFAARLLAEAHVATVPGSGFGIEGHLRLSFATATDTLTEALDHLERFATG
jgi:aspartate aminotransferase